MNPSGMVQHSAALVAVPPGVVLHRGSVADRGPNSGTPSHLACSPAADAPAMAPWSVASCQCSTARCVRPLRSAPARRHPRHTRRVPGCAYRSRRRRGVYGSADRPRQRCGLRGATPVAASTRSQSMVTPLSRRTPASPISSTATSPTCRAPVCVTRSRRRSAASVPSRSICGSGSGATKVTATSRSASDAAASQPMNPEPITTADVAVSAASRSTRASASERSRYSALASRDGRGDGRCAASQHQDLERMAPITDVHGMLDDIQPVDRCIADKLDRPGPSTTVRGAVRCRQSGGAGSPCSTAGGRRAGRCRR